MDHVLALRSLAPVLFFVVAACDDRRSPPPPPQPSPLQSALEAEVAKPGITSAIGRIEIGSEVLFAGAAGTLSRTDATAARPDTPFRAASVGKLFTATAVLRLVERGLLGLDTPIGSILSLEVLDRLHVLGGVSRGRDLTVRQLLAHTSGLPDVDSNPAFFAAIVADPTHVWTPSELIEIAVDVGPAFVPGEDQLYSSANYWLLGLVIEAVTQDPFHVVVREEVLDRLGMAETFEETNEGTGPRALAHSYIGDADVNLASPSFEFADGGFVSTAADLARFGHAIARGELFEDPNTMTAMLTSHGDALIGLGPWLATTELESGPTAVVFHPGYWGVQLIVVPALDAVIVFTVNQSEADSTDLATAFFQSIP